MDEHKKTADTPPSAGTSISASPTPHGKILVCCPEHGGKEVELYCETCGEVICSKCALKNGRHHSHEYEELNKAYDKYQGEILVSIEPMKEQLAVTNKTLTQLDTRRKEIGIQQAVVEATAFKTPLGDFMVFLMFGRLSSSASFTKSLGIN